MSTHSANRIPNNLDWFIFDAYHMEIKILTPKFINQIYDKGYRKIYLSYGPRYAKAQHNYQLTSADLILPENIVFDVVLIDSLNCCHNNISNIIKSKLYIIGNDQSYGFSNSWISDTFTNPFDDKNSEAFVNYNEFSNFKQESYPYASWFYNDTVHKILDLPRKLSPEDLRKQQIQKHLDSSVFGKIIEVLMKYSKNNWMCISYNGTKIDDHHFTEKYNTAAQTILNQCPIKYTFLEKQYIGGSIVKPICPIYLYEFEHFFGFGSKCGGYKKDRTRYFYSYKMSVYKEDKNSIYTFLNDFVEVEWDREFLKFIVWLSINYLGILNSHEEKKCAEELAVLMKQNKLTQNELTQLIYPIPFKQLEIL